MLLGGKGGCQQCTCVPCNPCERTCTNPHTGAAFEVVYTRFFEGAEAGNTTDGFFTATGDSDTSDPYDGMDGDGPWYQRVSGGFTLGGSSPGTRFPCSVVVSFWRNNYVLGASTIPPPSSALTENIVEVIVSTGSLVAPDGRVITAADGAVTVGSVPLVSGGGDASTSDPHTGEGTVSYSSLCDNVETTFTIRATIRWNTKKRQHVLYGLVRECYDEPDPDDPTVTSCDTFCDGDPPPDALYLTISGLSSAPGWAPTTGSLSDASLLNGTYVIDPWLREAGICNQYLSRYDSDCSDTLFKLVAIVNIGNGFGIYPASVATMSIGGYKTFSNKCHLVVLKCTLPSGETEFDVCSSTSGTGELELHELPYGTASYLTTFSWTLSP
jgi:hypothetical protein